MTQEDKNLLLKDLCSRLPYNTEIQVNDWVLLTTTLKVGHISRLLNEDLEIKPYLFPLSSMSEELKNFIRWKLTTPKHDSFDEDSIEDLLTNNVQVVNYCYEHHLDINGLIEKGLAIEVK